MFKPHSLKHFLAVMFLGLSALGQSGFTPGNLVISRSVYMGDANTVAVGQSLPPVCPASAETAKKGQCAAKAVANGSYPNVFTNASVDASFGVTSPIFLDQLDPATGAVLGTLAIPANMVTTSFPSKSELALNVSTDGTALTFMAYVAPPNTLDASMPILRASTMEPTLWAPAIFGR